MVHPAVAAPVLQAAVVRHHGHEHVVPAASSGKIFEGLLEILYPPDGAPGPRLHGDLSAPAGEARLLAVTLGPGHRQLLQPGARGPRPAFTSCSYKHIGKWVEKTTCLVSFHFQII